MLKYVKIFSILSVRTFSSPISYTLNFTSNLHSIDWMLNSLPCVIFSPREVCKFQQYSIRKCFKNCLQCWLRSFVGLGDFCNLKKHITHLESTLDKRKRFLIIIVKYHYNFVLGFLS